MGVMDWPPTPSGPVAPYVVADTSTLLRLVGIDEAEVFVEHLAPALFVPHAVGRELVGIAGSDGARMQATSKRTLEWLLAAGTPIQQRRTSSRLAEQFRRRLPPRNVSDWGESDGFAVAVQMEVPFATEDHSAGVIARAMDRPALVAADLVMAAARGGAPVDACRAMFEKIPFRKKAMRTFDHEVGAPGLVLDRDGIVDQREPRLADLRQFVPTEATMRWLVRSRAFDDIVSALGPRLVVPAAFLGSSAIGSTTDAAWLRRRTQIDALARRGCSLVVQPSPPVSAGDVAALVAQELPDGIAVRMDDERPPVGGAVRSCSRAAMLEALGLGQRVGAPLWSLVNRELRAAIPDVREHYFLVGDRAHKEGVLPIRRVRGAEAVRSLPQLDSILRPAVHRPAAAGVPDEAVVDDVSHAIGEPSPVRAVSPDVRPQPALGWSSSPRPGARRRRRASVTKSSSTYVTTSVLLGLQQLAGDDDALAAFVRALSAPLLVVPSAVGALANRSSGPVVQPREVASRWSVDWLEQAPIPSARQEEWTGFRERVAEVEARHGTPILDNARRADADVLFRASLEPGAVLVARDASSFLRRCAASLPDGMSAARMVPPGTFVERLVRASASEPGPEAVAAIIEALRGEPPRPLPARAHPSAPPASARPRRSPGLIPHGLG